MLIRRRLIVGEPTRGFPARVACTWVTSALPQGAERQEDADEDAANSDLDLNLDAAPPRAVARAERAQYERKVNL